MTVVSKQSTYIQKLITARTALLEAAKPELDIEALYICWKPYGISESDQEQWQKLIKRLAKKYIKDFAADKSKPVWTLDREIEFYCDYSWLKGKYPKKSDAKICEILHTIKPWNGRNSELSSIINRLPLVKNSLREKGLLEAFTLHHKK